MTKFQPDKLVKQTNTQEKSSSNKKQSPDILGKQKPGLAIKKKSPEEKLKYEGSQIQRLLNQPPGTVLEAPIVSSNVKGQKNQQVKVLIYTVMSYTQKVCS